MSLFRNTRRLAMAREAKAMATGEWPPWVEHPERPVSNGWVGRVNRVVTNGVYCVMIRRFPSSVGEMHHAAIRNVSNTDIPWAHKQRIKNELFGSERVAVEVFPQETLLIDEADMYHLFVYPIGFEMPFGIHGTQVKL